MRACRACQGEIALHMLFENLHHALSLLSCDLLLISLVLLGSNYQERHHLTVVGRLILTRLLYCSLFLTFALFHFLMSEDEVFDGLLEVKLK